VFEKQDTFYGFKSLSRTILSMYSTTSHIDNIVTIYVNKKK